MLEMVNRPYMLFKLEASLVKLQFCADQFGAGFIFMHWGTMRRQPQSIPK